MVRYTCKYNELMYTKLMRNPFLYGQSVTGDNFCNRIKELSDINRHIESGQNLFIYSNRRIGKTSLVRQALIRLSKNKGIVSIFIDLERITSKAQFLEIYAQAIANAFVSLSKIEKIRDFFRALIPRIEFSPTGEVSVSVEFSKSEASIRRGLEEVMDLPQLLAKKYKKRVVVVFDEFQEVANLNGVEFEKYIRSFIQHHKNVCYIFMGSKTRIIIDMFNNPKRAFYRSATVYPLNIPNEEMERYIKERFEATEKKISNVIAAEIVQKAQGLPHYVQMLAWHVWERCGNEVQLENINDATQQLLLSQRELYYTWYNDSTLNQKSILFALSQGDEVFSQDAIIKHDLRAASTVQSGIKSLVSKGFVNKEENKYALADPFFAIWLSKK